MRPLYARRLDLAVIKKKHAIFGELAEWSKAAVLKTVEGKPSGGSNPSLSAINEKAPFTGAFSFRDVGIW